MTRAVTIGRKPHRNKSPARSHTSPKAIRLQQRRAEALDYRLQGYSYHQISKEMRCNPSTVYNLVCEAMVGLVPPEKVEEAFALDMARCDQMLAAIFGNAREGDLPSIDACLKIMSHRARLMGLNRDGSQAASVHFTVNAGDDKQPDAEDVGIRVEFVRSRHAAVAPERITYDGKSADNIRPFTPRIMPPPDDPAA
jgi:DNA-binding CsgD family transcriptional regulator